MKTKTLLNLLSVFAAAAVMSLAVISVTDSTISNAAVNNSQYEYILGLQLPSASTSLYGVVIEYTLDRPY